MYLYEMHCHTSESSKCGRGLGSEMADFFKRLGFSGICITDHFFNGNCAVPKELEWKERVELFCKGYENAKKRGDEIGLSVFFGWECSYQGTDILTYNLTKEWLLENENCDLLDPNAYCDLVHNSGGVVIQAHPFRERGYIPIIKLLPRKVDGVEIFNAGNEDFENVMAEVYAKMYELPVSSGSDIHSPNAKRVGKVELDFEAKSLKEITDAIINRKAKAGSVILESE